MNSNKISDRLGDWNPQLLRELKGRINSNSLIFILIASTVIQLMVGLWLVHGDRAEQRLVSGFQCLNWLLPIGATFGGTYSLISDFNRERKSGTLDFIKSSPQSGRSIFLGKLIGVPSLVYLAILSLVPLHLGLALFNGASLGLMLLWYLTVGTIGYFCLVLTCLYVLYGGKLAILYALLISQPISAVLALYNYYLSLVTTKMSWLNTDFAVNWFYLPINNNIWLFYIFTCCTLLTISSWLWIAIDRKYIDPIATPIEKKDSYTINFCTQLWLVGFALPLIKSTTNEDKFYIIWIFQTISTIWIICMIPALLPNRKSLQEWMSSWQQKHGNHQQFNWRNPKLIRELIWGDRSPVVLAIGINLAMAAIAWVLVTIVVSILSSNIDLFIKFILGAVMSSILALIYTVIVHLQCLRSHLKNSEVIPVIFLMSFLPLVCSFLLFTGWTSNLILKDLGLALLLFSPLFWMGISQLSYPLVVLTAIAQLGILMGLLKIFKHQLLKLGELKMPASSQRQLITGRGSS